MLSPDTLQMMQTGMASPDLVEDDRKTNLIVNYLPQTMTQVSWEKMFKNISRLFQVWIKIEGSTSSLEIDLKRSLSENEKKTNIFLSFRRRFAPYFLPSARLRAVSSSGTRSLARALATASSTTSGRRMLPRRYRLSMDWGYRTKPSRWGRHSPEIKNTLSPRASQRDPIFRYLLLTTTYYSGFIPSFIVDYND